MHILAALVLLGSTSGLAQEALTIHTPPGKPLVWYPEIVVPGHDLEKDMVAFRIHESQLDDGDIPFFVDRTGIVVPKEGLDAAVERLRGIDPVTVLVCSFPEAGSFNLVRRDVRGEFCTPWRRNERQP